MKRSNRLVILVGVLLAVLAFVAIVILLNSQEPQQGVVEDATETVLVANEEIEIGEEITPDKVREEEVDPDAVVGTPLRSTTELQGQPAIFSVPADSQVSAETIGRVGQGIVDLPALLNPGEKAIAFQVDRVTGTNFLVKPGDTIDIILSQSISVLQETADSAANPDAEAPPRFETVTGLENQRTVKAILQDKRVIYVSATRAIEPEPVEDTNEDGVIDDRDEAPVQGVIDSVIIVFAGTAQDGEVIKFAQNADGEAGALTAIVRNADDEGVIEDTLGITIDQLVEEYGLRIPNIVEQLTEDLETP